MKSKMSKIFGLISWKIFFISFVVGLMFIYVLGPENKKVYVYPNPNTIDKAIFQDKTNACFKFKEKTVTCPLDKKEISQIPIQ